SAEAVHVLLFVVDDGTLIDAANGGNESRFINHSCAPNCSSIEEDGRIFLEARRAIRCGEELTYDYRLQHPDAADEEVRRRYPCRCGAARCRGSMMLRARRRR